MALTSSHTRIITHLLVIITVSAIAVSRSPENGRNWRAVRNSPVRRLRANERSTYFDLELLEVLGRSFQNRNMIISPISIKVTLGMLMEGASGETRNEIAHALRLFDDPEATRKEVRNWVSLFKANKTRTELKLATQIFLSRNNEVNPEYGNILRTHYMGDVSNINVANAPESAKRINDWVSGATNGFIPTLVDKSQINDYTTAILASAVYFKSKWYEPFSNIIKNCFYKTPGVCSDTVFMQETVQLNHAYVSSLEADVVEIPYKDDRYSMVIMVPKGRVQELTRDLQHGHLTDILSKLTPTEVNIQLPRFTADSEQDVIPALQILQINQLFGPGANLSAMFTNANGLLTVSNILHSAKIIVDEDGTEAAGATAAHITTLILEAPTTFLVNKPFVFLIRDSVTNVILFSGQIFDPEKAKTSAEQIHEIFDKSSVVDNTNNLEQSIYLEALDKDNNNKPHSKPGPPENKPVKYGKPGGFLPQSPDSLPINYPSDGAPSTNIANKNSGARSTPRPQYLTTTAYPLYNPKPLQLNARPTLAPQNLRTTAPPLLKRTTAPPLYRGTTAPSLERRTTQFLDRRTTKDYPIQVLENFPSSPPPGSFKVPSYIRHYFSSDTRQENYWNGTSLHKQINTTYFKISELRKRRRSSDDRIVFAQ